MNMFDRDQPKIAAYGLSSPDAMADVFTFTLLTIQQPLHSVPRAMKDVKARGDRSNMLWGMKATGWRYIQEHKQVVYHDMLELGYTADPDRRQHELLDYLALFPGLGMVKAGFIAQMLFGEIGCIDTHNLDRFGLKSGMTSQPTWIKSSAYKDRRPAKRVALRETYLTVVAKAGGPRALWNDWCTYVHEKYPAIYVSPDKVSRIHCEALGL